MSLQETLAEHLKEAMRQRDLVRVSTLRLLRGAIRNEEIAREMPPGERLSDNDVLGVVAREVKQRRESIEEFRKGNRLDLVGKEEAEIAVLQSYLPQALTRDEITTSAQRIIAEVGAQGPRDMGKVMPRLMAEVRGRADGREVNALVADLLRQSNPS